MTPEELVQTVEEAVSPAFRASLLARGQARAMIWSDGVLPAGAPRFAANLSYDLLSYGTSLLLLSLRLYDTGQHDQLMRSGFEHAGDAIESVVSNGDREDPQRGFYRVLAGAAYHLGRFSARAYSLLRGSLDSENLSTMERCLALLVLRSLDKVEEVASSWQDQELASDDTLLSLLQKGEVADHEEEDDTPRHLEAVDLALTDNYIRALATFTFALETGEPQLVDEAQRMLDQGVSVCGEINLVPQWWCYKLTSHLIDDLWDASFHVLLPVDGGPSQEDSWADTRWLYIATLFRRGRAEVELWPSQTEAASRAVDTSDDLVVSLPTSAGKTRIAELCILRALANGKRAIYVTPLRALSAQTEVGLRRTFSPLGKSVTALYGSMGATSFDEDALRTRDIVVATPEKLDFALRSDPSLLDDVGVIVLDEGHMIGLGDREVRYEVQIQRLLKREDADERRIVCLSAMLPDGEQFDDFVAWLRRDQDGEAVRADWRPTRVRFGVIEWGTDSAQLKLNVGDESPFVPNFVRAFLPPIGKRRTDFPKDDRELILAATWKFVADGQTVLIYCPQRNSVKTYYDAIIDLNNRGALPSLFEDEPPGIEIALALGKEWLGEDHPILQCLRLGVAIHHGKLPTAYRREVERLLRDGVLPVTVSSPTLAQGLNLTASTLIFASLHRYGELIPPHEFKNVVGRAGRAFIDVEGQIVVPVFKEPAKRRSDWNKLVADARTRNMQSGLALLVLQLLKRLNKSLGKIGLSAMSEYVLNNAAAWEFPQVGDESDEDYDDALHEWERNIATLDMAILSLVGEEESEETDVAGALDDILSSSLWARLLGRQKEEQQELFRDALISRARLIWGYTNAAQRRGYFLAGVGWTTGRALDDAAERTNRLLVQASGSILEGDIDEAVNFITALADILFDIKPFVPEELPDDWVDILGQWLRGGALSEIEGEKADIIEFVEDAFVYRLPWAVNAVRVRALANGDTIDDFSFDNFETGLAVPALETGTLSPSAALTMQAGFSSRLAAIKAVEDLNAEFTTMTGLRQWLSSDEVKAASMDDTWPTPESAVLWCEFLESRRSDDTQTWKTDRLMCPVYWYEDVDLPKGGSLVRLRKQKDGTVEVASASFHQLGRLDDHIGIDPSGIAYGRVQDTDEAVLEIILAGPEVAQNE